MKKIILSALLLCSALKVVPVAAQRSCGQQAFFEQLEAQHPGAISRAKAMRDAAAVRAVSQAPGNIFSKTTEAPLIPVVFHIVLDAAQLQQAGGTAGIEDRIKTQLEVLNKDFNALNSDASKIPDVWKSLYANIGLRFGLAVKTESGADTKGYDIRLAATGTTFSDYAAGCPTAKKYAKGGLDPWNYNKYLNIWIVNTIVLGVTAPPGLPDFPADERGVVLNYQAFGSRSSSSQSFMKGYDKGRTLTHELGHFFHLWHTWGDDNGLCPGEPGGEDDGIADTPPEAAAAYNTPTYPLYDKCSPTGSSNGVMFMNYLDYTSDAAMYMFTTQQANVIRGEIAPGGNSWSLTQNPGLAKEPDVVPKDSMGDVIQVRPNPSSSGIFQIRYDSGRNELKRLAVYNSIGQVIFTSEEPNITSIDLSAYNKGMYILRCWFDKRTITEKIVFQ